MDIPRITPQEDAERIRHGDALAFVDAHVGDIPRGPMVVAYCT